MIGLSFSTGLSPVFATPPIGPQGLIDMITEEAAIVAGPGQDLRVDLLVEEGATVSEGAAVARLRDAPEIALVAPMAGRVGRIGLGAGRKLSEIVLFHEAGGDTVAHDVGGAASSGTALRALMQAAGYWPRLRRRPFGGMPGPGERPAAIFVMAADTRPFAVDPERAIAEREEEVERGLAALASLGDGPVFLCHGARSTRMGALALGAAARPIAVGARHPHGLAGHVIHKTVPARIDAPVWDLHVEDVADLGALLADGRLPQTRHVQVAGAAMTESRLVRCQAGADLRALCYGAVRPGPHRIFSGSPLDGHRAQWLAPLDRQATVLAQPDAAPDPHWFRSALTRWSLPPPVIPTAGLAQSVGGAFPVMPMIRALAVGDDEAALRLGVLSLLEEDLALLDFVTGGQSGLAGRLRDMLGRIRTEMAA